MPKYTDQDKAKAIKAWQQHGTAEAARQTGISTRTIKRWVAADPTVAQANSKQMEEARRELARRTKERREQLRAKLMEKALDLLGRMDEPHVDFKGKDAGMVTYPIATSGDVKNYAVAAAVLIDKFRLEMGEVTGRSENITVEQAVSRLDEEIAEMLAEMEGT